jgi:hypothetical protein
MPNNKKSNKKNTKISRPLKSLPPGHSMTHLKDESAVTVTTTSNSGLFELTQVAINMRSSNLGPNWVNVASDFLMFRVIRGVIKFRSSQPTTDVGMLAMSYFADPYTTPTTFQEVNAGIHAVSSRLYANLSVKVPSSGWLYVNLQNTEQRLSDHGSIVLASQFTTTAITPGILVSDFVIEFKGEF